MSPLAANRDACLRIFLGKVTAVICLMLGFALISPGLATEIRGGWTPQFPYQFEITGSGSYHTLSGLDIEVMRAAARRAGFRPVFKEVPWEATLGAIRVGELDFGMGATPETSRQDWAWFSIPYRKETISMFTRRGEAKRFRGTAIEAIMQVLNDGGKIGVVGAFYYGPDVDRLIKDGRFRDQFVEFNEDKESLAATLAGSVDAFLAERLAAASAASKLNAVTKLDALPGIIYETDVSIIFSKKTFSPEQLEAFNLALSEMQESGETNQIVRHYLVPHILQITMRTTWFRIFEVIGTIAFAISGVLIARRERYDIAGAFVLAALPSVGGGVMRDLISGRSPIGIIQAPNLLLVVVGTVLAGMLFYIIHDLVSKPGAAPKSTDGRLRCLSTPGMLEISDAIGLATFTIVGVIVAIEQRCEPILLWGPLMAAITAAGGGVLRDVLRSRADIPTLKGSIYPEIAAFWGFIYSAIIFVYGAELILKQVLVLTIVTIALAFATRILVVHFGLRSIFLGFREETKAE